MTSWAGPRRLSPAVRSPSGLISLCTWTHTSGMDPCTHCGADVYPDDLTLLWKTSGWSLTTLRAAVWKEFKENISHRHFVMDMTGSHKCNAFTTYRFTRFHTWRQTNQYQQRRLNLGHKSIRTQQKMFSTLHKCCRIAVCWKLWVSHTRGRRPRLIPTELADGASPGKDCPERTDSASVIFCPWDTKTSQQGAIHVTNQWQRQLLYSKEQ